MALSAWRRAGPAVLLCSLVLLAGCGALLDGPDDSTAELGPVTVENGDDVAHTIHVLVERDGEPVSGTSVGLDGASPPTDERAFGRIESAILNRSTWPDDGATWTVYTRVDSNASWQAHAVPSAASCTAVRLVIEPDASVTSFFPACGAWPPADADAD